eukprot:CAMPEP_0173334492 /NCGR_PEP_ID=MMETSP1144-20121109/5463_1 /TAXON_ID=483371 /ORGANISM="non described non described, Strain CCMP2298" /LENGTH=197 /DNA_ID=CAMNT_0014279543 /DNA_START=859 /DNA_END=1448 /DNA_ORIENTATION=-
MSLEYAFVLGNVRELLGPACDPQLRLVSKSCHTSMATVPREGMHLEDYLSSLALFLWAVQELKMPWRGPQFCEVVAGGGHLEVLQWSRAQRPAAPWGVKTVSAAARGGHLQVVEWLRAQEPPCSWSINTCAAAAAGGQLEVMRWMRGQTPPCPWDGFTSVEAARGGHIELLQWLQDQTPPLEQSAGTLAAAAECGQL